MPRKQPCDLPASAYNLSAFDGDAPPPPEISPNWSPSTVQVEAKQPPDALLEIKKALNEQTDKMLAAVHAVKSQPPARATFATILADPCGHPTMSLQQAAEACGKSKQTIYFYLQTGKLQKALKGRVRTDSVLKLLQANNSAD